MRLEKSCSSLIGQISFFFIKADPLENEDLGVQIECTARRVNYNMHLQSWYVVQLNILQDALVTIWPRCLRITPRSWCEIKWTKTLRVHRAGRSRVGIDTDESRHKHREWAQTTKAEWTQTDLTQTPGHKGPWTERQEGRKTHSGQKETAGQKYSLHKQRDWTHTKTRTYTEWTKMRVGANRDTVAQTGL